MPQNMQTLISAMPKANPFAATASEIALKRAKDEQVVYERRIERSGVPRRFYGAKLDHCNTKVRQWFRDFERGEGSWLILSGDNGTGKTHQACACLLEAAKQNQVYFTTMNGFMTKLQNTFGTSESAERVLYHYQNSPLLVVDELEKFKATEWSAAQMFELFNSRHARQKATIITTNLTPDRLFMALSKAAGEELAASLLSRFSDKQNVSVRFTGADRRSI